MLAVIVDEAPPKDIAKAQACVSFTVTIVTGVCHPTYARLFDPSTPESAAKLFYVSIVLVGAGVAVLAQQLLTLAAKHVPSSCGPVQ